MYPFTSFVWYRKWCGGYWECWSYYGKVRWFQMESYQYGRPLNIAKNNPPEGRIKPGITRFLGSETY